MAKKKKDSGFSDIEQIEDSASEENSEVEKVEVLKTKKNVEKSSDVTVPGKYRKFQN